MTPGPVVPIAVILEGSQACHALWRAWVAGEIPGYPDDDEALLEAQNTASQAIRRAHGC